jgi:hypothetical protein
MIKKEEKEEKEVRAYTGEKRKPVL